MTEQHSAASGGKTLKIMEVCAVARGKYQTLKNLQKIAMSAMLNNGSPVLFSPLMQKCETSLHFNYNSQALYLSK